MGSDYTEGVKGIGIVNTMEILKVFDTFEKLKHFQKWAKKADLLLDEPEFKTSELIANSTNL